MRRAAPEPAGAASAPAGRGEASHQSPLMRPDRARSKADAAGSGPRQNPDSVPDSVPDSTPGSEPESLDKAITHTLEEARMVLPGVQALFGFQLIAVFNKPFYALLAPAQQRLHLGGMVLTALSVAPH